MPVPPIRKRKVKPFGQKRKAATGTDKLRSTSRILFANKNTHNLRFPITISHCISTFGTFLSSGNHYKGCIFYQKQITKFEIVEIEADKWTGSAYKLIESYLQGENLPETYNDAGDALASVDTFSIAQHFSTRLKNIAQSGKSAKNFDSSIRTFKRLLPFVNDPLKKQKIIEMIEAAEKYRDQAVSIFKQLNRDGILDAVLVIDVRLEPFGKRMSQQAKIILQEYRDWSSAWQNEIRGLILRGTHENDLSRALFGTTKESLSLLTELKTSSEEEEKEEDIVQKRKLPQIGGRKKKQKIEAIGGK